MTSNKVLLIIDVQNAFFLEGGSPVPNGKALIERISGVIDKARENSNVKVIWIRHGDPSDAEFKPNTELWEIAAPLKPKIDSEPIIEKTTPDSFYETTLGEVVDSIFPSTGTSKPDITIIGLQSDVCVRASSTEAKRRYPEGDIKLVHGCHGTYDYPNEGKTAEDVVSEIEKEIAEKGVKIIALEDLGF